ncbi:MAG: hypothetical protein U9R11_04220 [Chloroflexota bacterium]|nr:hypothetical protein [Chloroflexota bacterium]
MNEKSGSCQKIEDLKRLYPDTWLLVKVEDKDALGIPTAGQLLAHSKDADSIWDEVAGLRGQFYIFYTGEILRDTAVIFYA